MFRPIAFAALFALAACAKSEEASLVPIDESEGFNMIDPVPAPIEQASELTLGEWTQGLQEERPALLFGPAGAPPLFSMRCDDSDGLILQRHGVVLVGEPDMMMLTLGTTASRLAVNPVTDMAVPLLRAAIPANDDLLVQLSAAATPITIAIGDGPALNLPPSPLIADLVRGCAAEPPPPPTATANSAAAETGDAAAAAGQGE